MNNIEKTIEEITKITVEKLGDKATPELVKKIVGQVWNKMNSNSAPELNHLQQRAEDFETMPKTRVILSAVGREKPGVVAGISAILAKHNASIQDMTQSLLQEFFTLIMVVDISKADLSFEQLKNELEELGNKIQVKILLQHEEIFKFMYRV